MRIKALKKLLHIIIDEGYGDWIVWFCDDDNDDYSVNHIYIDDDGDVCLESTDQEGDNYDFTAQNILSRIKKYDNEEYVYFTEIYWDGSYNDYDIVFEWYIGYNDAGESVLNIDCEEI